MAGPSEKEEVLAAVLLLELLPVLVASLSSDSLPDANFPNLPSPAISHTRIVYLSGLGLLVRGKRTHAKMKRSGTEVKQ